VIDHEFIIYTVEKIEFSFEFVIMTVLLKSSGVREYPELKVTEERGLVFLKKMKHTVIVANREVCGN